MCIISLKRRNMNTHKVYISLLATFSLSACAAFSPNEVAQPSKLTIADAMADIGTGFANLKRSITQYDSDYKIGMWPCKVAVTLNVTANAEMGGKLVLDTSLKAPAKVVDGSITGHAEQTNTSSAARGNTISIDMYNVACIPNNTLAYDKPDKVIVVGKSLGAIRDGAPTFVP